jgi:hypothetical protein
MIKYQYAEIKHLCPPFLKGIPKISQCAFLAVRTKLQN